MKKPLSLRHKVRIVGRVIDLQRTNVAETFARVRREQAEQARIDEERREATEKEVVEKVREIKRKMK